MSCYSDYIFQIFDQFVWRGDHPGYAPIGCFGIGDTSPHNITFDGIGGKSIRKIKYIHKYPEIIVMIVSRYNIMFIKAAGDIGATLSDIGWVR